MSERQSAIKNLRPGQHFLWAGRVVEFVRASDHYAKPTGKKGRRLLVRVGNEERALWYQDKEKVTLVQPVPTEVRPNPHDRTTCDECLELDREEERITQREGLRRLLATVALSDSTEFVSPSSGPAFAGLEGGEAQPSCRCAEGDARG